MARTFRYYEKKRGNRRTVSPVLALLGEAAFFALFLLLGCLGLAVLFSSLVVPEWRVNHEFLETTCKVLDRRIGEKQGENGAVFRPEFDIEYQVQGKSYRGWHYDFLRDYSTDRDGVEAVLRSFALYDPAKNNRSPCWYDPGNPEVAVLVRQSDWWLWLVFTVPGSFIVIGTGGLVYTLVHWGKSAERRALIAKRSEERILFGLAATHGEEFPSVPKGADLTNSPGTRLRYRLPMTRSPGWILTGSLAFCLLWNGIVAVFVAMALGGHLSGDPDWFLTALLVPFVLIGLGAIYYFLRQLLLATGIGPTFVELSGHPLIPGESYRAFLSQTGRLTIHALHVALVCEESTTYRQGTDTRTETREVFRRRVFSRERFEIERGLPFEVEFDLEVPAGAMHSFAAQHNEINWTLVVEGDVANWPDFRRAFSLIVCPRSAEAAS